MNVMCDPEELDFVDWLDQFYAAWQNPVDIPPNAWKAYTMMRTWVQRLVSALDNQWFCPECGTEYLACCYEHRLRHLDAISLCCEADVQAVAECTKCKKRCPTKRRGMTKK